MIFIFASFLLRIFISTYNYLYGPIYGGEFDAIAFHEEAIYFSQLLKAETNIFTLNYDYKIGWYYSNFLGLIYYFLDNHQLLYGLIISCVFWLLSGFVFYRILLKMEFSKIRINILCFIYCFLFPTSIIYHSLTLRESYLLFFFNLLILIFLNLYSKKNIVLNIILLILTSIPFMLLHDANILFIIIFFIFFVCSFLIQKYFTTRYLIEIIFLLVLFVSCILEFLEPSINENIFNLIKSYRIGHFYDSLMSRAFYTYIEDIKDLNYDYILLFKFLIFNFFNYMFQPFPWMITSPIDFILVFENGLRLYLLIRIFKNALKIRMTQLNQYYLFIILFLSLLIMEFIYSQATVNWGTASRHHSISNGLLILLAFVFKNRSKRILLK